MQKNAFHTLSYGVYAVTTMDGERPVGCIANSAMQITSQPPTLARAKSCPCVGER